jgi:hypothetical protein
MIDVSAGSIGATRKNDLIVVMDCIFSFLG